MKLVKLETDAEVIRYANRRSTSKLFDSLLSPDVGIPKWSSKWDILLSQCGGSDSGIVTEPIMN